MRLRGAVLMQINAASVYNVIVILELRNLNSYISDEIKWNNLEQNSLNKLSVLTYKHKALVSI
jgi:hypothetical protein